MLIGKRHFNFAMSRARRSVTEKDLTLFEEFTEKQKSGRGEAASNFKFGSKSSSIDTGIEEENDADASTTASSIDTSLVNAIDETNEEEKSIINCQLKIFKIMNLQSGHYSINLKQVRIKIEIFMNLISNKVKKYFSIIIFKYIYFILS